MRTRERVLIGLCSCLWMAAVFTGAGAAATGAGQTIGGGTIDYERQIQPILAQACLECHSQDKRKGGLSLATYSDILDGGRDGAIVRPGNSANSLIVHRITGTVEPQMPKDDLPLDAAEIALLKQWIDQGARATPTSPPAPQPWEAPLTLTRPDVPPVAWAPWSEPIDRFVAAYLTERKAAEPAIVSDATYARRVYLDVWGLLPTPEQLQAFVTDSSPAKREALVTSLLADSGKYADHWISFWNDLLRNEDGVTYFSETASRKSITEWLYPALTSNQPYDQFVAKLLNPADAGDPEGFLIGVNWRGETSAAVTPWMQAAQNTAQIFLGVNLKCNACHDSFVSKWKLKEAYSLAAYFSAEPRLRLYRCDVAQDVYADPAFLFPELDRKPATTDLQDRRSTVAAIFTDRRNGRLARTFVNRVWTRLLGHGIVPNSDEMDGKPWSPALLDFVASEFVEHGYDVKWLIRTILVSRAYQMPAVARTTEPPARNYAFDGPEIRRMTAEQFVDAIGAITGEWSVYQPRTPTGAARRDPLASDPPTSGVYGREWRAASSTLTRALGRPIRDQVISTRASQSTTPQALELVNGEMLTAWLSRGAQRLIGRLPDEPLSLYNKAVAGRNATSSRFDVDISGASRLWLVVHDFGSNAPERVEPLWSQVELVGPDGEVPLAKLTAVDRAGLRVARAAAAGSATETISDDVRVKNPSQLVYDISGRGFTRLRGTIAIDNPRSEIGSTLNPQVRFFVFDHAPNLERLIPTAPGVPMPAATVVTSRADAVDRIFKHALGRAPNATERRLASTAIVDAAHPGRPSADGLADLLWAVLMKPEFQLIY